MSKNDMLGPITRALVSVPQSRLPLILDVTNRLHVNAPQGDAWHDHLSKSMRDGLSPVESPPPLLVFDEQHAASVRLEHPHDPQAFWHDTQESPARYVWPGFLAAIAQAKPIEETGIVKVPYADLSRGTTVREILVTSGVGDYGPSRLSKVIASMIAAQPNGEFLKDGLISDGKANLFPCGSLLVRVYWDGADRGWSVGDWGPGREVFAGRRVFSGNLIR
jgi:hypothetical protein